MRWDARADAIIYGGIKAKAKSKIPRERFGDEENKRKGETGQDRTGQDRTGQDTARTRAHAQYPLARRAFRE